MKTIKKRTYPPVSMGISLILVTFIILCMVILSILSLSGAWKDYQYSEKNAQRTSAYYEANNTAEEILADLYKNPPKDTSDIEYLVPISDSESLQVILKVISCEKPEYIVASWKQISTKVWNGDQTLPVLGSN